MATPEQMKNAKLEIEVTRDFGTKSLDLSNFGLNSDELTTLYNENSEFFLGLEEFHLGYNNLVELPDWIGNILDLRILDVSHNKLVTLPENIGRLSDLKELNAGFNNLVELPDSLGRLINLSILDISHNLLREFPESMRNLIKLVELQADNNNLVELPEWVGELVNLEGLLLFRNYLTKLPDSLGDLLNLTILNISHNDLRGLPASLGRLRNLTTLIMASIGLTELPDWIGNLDKLKELDISHNYLAKLPSTIAKLRALSQLLVGYNKLESISPAKSLDLESLGLDGNESIDFSDVPDQVKHLDISGTAAGIPRVKVLLGRLKSLELVDLTGLIDRTGDGGLFESLLGRDNPPIVCIAPRRAYSYDQPIGFLNKKGYLISKDRPGLVTLPVRFHGQAAKSAKEIIKDCKALVA